MVNGEYFLMCLKAAIRYIPNNIVICVATIVLCLIFGSLIAVARNYRVPVLAQFFDVLMALFKALPANLILLICTLLYTMNFTKIVEALHLNISIQDVSLIYVAIFSLVICSVSGISEVIRGSLLSVPHGQYEAGYSVGLTRWQTFRTIVIPQAARAMVAPLTNSIISMMKRTSLVSVIGVMDIINGATTAASTAYCYMEAYLAASLVFWVIGFILEQLSRLTEKHFSKSVKTLA